ncbi:uncharacterized protein EDB93DRAFT_1254750 [Suillus bovinus]|uniref:uncharacterized protein n=1 Tax=Suillus bovinus TaxID=48563 RepID=UPI001B87F72F|nr:uncharacterized protein EDB93DRAFT_1254750 [Suillus bovinus]KAG2133653.1 hypothetical protein EDB93DRAFT_1254750 [Suillus bovinus]
MKFTTVLVALVSAVPVVFGLTINTPANVVECQPILFSWSGGQSPYYLTLVPGGQSMAAAIKSFPTQTGTSYTWNVDLQANTIFNIALKDTTGAVAYSDIITIMPGSDTSCVNTAVNEGGASSGSAATSGTSTPTSGSSASPSGTSSSGAKTSATTTASSGTAQKTGAASSLSVSSAMGVAGVMGLVGAALF